MRIFECCAHEKWTINNTKYDHANMNCVQCVWLYAFSGRNERSLLEMQTHARAHINVPNASGFFCSVWRRNRYTQRLPLYGYKMPYAGVCVYVCVRAGEQNVMNRTMRMRVSHGHVLCIRIYTHTAAAAAAETNTHHSAHTTSARVYRRQNTHINGGLARQMSHSYTFDANVNFRHTLAHPHTHTGYRAQHEHVYICGSVCVCVCLPRVSISV